MNEYWDFYFIITESFEGSEGSARSPSFQYFLSLLCSLLVVTSYYHRLYHIVPNQCVLYGVL